jgi:hypothetical protein
MRFTYSHPLGDDEALSLNDLIGKQIGVTAGDLSGNGVIVAASYDLVTHDLQVTLEVPDDSRVARAFSRGTAPAVSRGPSGRDAPARGEAGPSAGS